jgi:hypothetical protein
MYSMCSIKQIPRLYQIGFPYSVVNTAEKKDQERDKKMRQVQKYALVFSSDLHYK